MRPTIVLLCTEEDFEVLRSRVSGIDGYTQGEVFDYFSFRGCRFGVSFSQETLMEYEDWEIDYIKGKIGDFFTVLLEHEKEGCVEPFLSEFLSGLNGLLDTNFDEIISYQEVFARFSENPKWDWSQLG